MLRHYILDEQRRPQQVELLVWAQWMGSSEHQRVARTEVGGYTVSTIFLGLDHNHSEAGPPILWESMLYDPDWEKEPTGSPLLDGLPGIHDIDMDRCAGSWEQAEEMHDRMVAKLAAALGIPAPSRSPRS